MNKLKTGILTKGACFCMLLISLNSCSGCSETEHTEAVTASIEAAQMMGRTDARVFVNRQWNDTSELHYRLRQIRERHDSLSHKFSKEYAAAYDSAFISTIRTVHPDLALHITRFNSDAK
ncbi:MAG: hypothetical protein K2J82_10980 [Muribaculaceae bacterium]|nr:hypothetical protein [Muribaculaceae bacterium]MDE6755118.1 hypothetical protein [Muribaculaceae bacterium]